MYYIGIDLHKQDLVMAVEDEHGPVGRPRRIACRDMDAILASVERWRPFRAVVEASASYRWLYDLLSPQGEVVLAHPLRLRAITAMRSCSLAPTLATWAAISCPSNRQNRTAMTRWS